MAKPTEDDLKRLSERLGETFKEYILNHPEFDDLDIVVLANHPEFEKANLTIMANDVHICLACVRDAFASFLRLEGRDKHRYTDGGQGVPQEQESPTFATRVNDTLMGKPPTDWN